jgi:hypothetical protein
MGNLDTRPAGGFNAVELFVGSYLDFLIVNNDCGHDGK